MCHWLRRMSCGGPVSHYLIHERLKGHPVNLLHNDHAAPLTPPRRFKFIGCEILYREACFLAATVPPRVDYSLTPLGLSLLVPVESLVEWAQENRSAIHAAREAFQGMGDDAEE